MLRTKPNLLTTLGFVRFLLAIATLARCGIIRIKSLCHLVVSSQPLIKFYLILLIRLRYISSKIQYPSHSIGPEADAGFVERFGPHFSSSRSCLSSILLFNFHNLAGNGQAIARAGFFGSGGQVIDTSGKAERRLT